MCNVCCASQALQATAKGEAASFDWSEPDKAGLAVLTKLHRKEGESHRAWLRRERETQKQVPRHAPEPALRPLRVEATGTQPEFTPARYRVARGDDPPSEWRDTDDLASVMAALGADVRWKYVHPVVQAWLRGKTDLLPVLAHLDHPTPHPKLTRRMAAEDR